MAAENRGEGAGLIDELFRAPHRFDFFQAVRLLGHLARERAATDPGRRPGPVGHDDPNREVATFRTPASLSFPTSAISQARDASGADASPELVVTFLGLTGPSGVLPRHYTELLIERTRERDHSLRDFLDLFHHRLISLFYRAWEKYRLPIGYERSKFDGPAGEPDPVTRGLYSLVGLGTAGLLGRRDVDDEVFLHYCGHFAHHPRSASALEGLLEDYLETPTRVLQLQAQWLPLDSDSTSLMPDASYPEGRNNALGVDLIVGDRVRDVQSRFRLRLGPLDLARFRTLMPNGGALRALGQVTRAFVGPELVFDVQPLLRADQVPSFELRPGQGDGFFLGWNTWLHAPTRDHPADEAVFEVHDI